MGRTDHGWGKRAPTLKFGCQVISGKASSSLDIPIWYREGWGWGLGVCSMLLFPTWTGAAGMGSETLDRGIRAMRADGQTVTSPPRASHALL